jgi:hypothetical protein
MLHQQFFYLRGEASTLRIARPMAAAFDTGIDARAA